MASTTTSSNLCSSGSSRTLAHMPTRSLSKVANSEAAGAAGMLIFQTRFYTASLLRDSCTYLIHQDESRLSVFQNILGTCHLLVGYHDRHAQKVLRSRTTQ